MNSNINKVGSKWTRPTWRKKQVLAKVGKAIVVSLVIACFTNVVAKAAETELDKAIDDESGIKNASVTNTAQAAGGLDIELVDVSSTSTTSTNTTSYSLVPGETVEKSPAIVNNSDLDAWVFMRVRIPCKNVRVVEDNKVSDYKLRPLLTYESEASSWTLLEKNNTQIDDRNYIEHTFVYNNRLVPSASTNSLFSELTMQNVVGADLQTDDSLSVSITAHGIQASASEDPASAWKLFLDQYSTSERSES